MKKFVLALIVLLSFAVTAVAAKDNSLSVYLEEPSFEELNVVLKDGRLSTAEITAAYGKFLASSPEDYGKTRGMYIYSLALLERKEKKKVKEILKVLESYEETLPDGSFERDTLHMEIASLHGAMERNLSSGLSLLEILKEYYGKWGEKEVYPNLAEGWKYINAPAVAGGSDKKAAEVFKRILEEEPNLPNEYAFSVLKGLGTALYNRKEYAEAKEYLERALQIYPYDTETLELQASIRKKLKK